MRDLKGALNLKKGVELKGTVEVKKSKKFLRYPAEFRLAQGLFHAAEFNVPFS